MLGRYYVFTVVYHGTALQRNKAHQSHVHTPHHQPDNVGRALLRMVAKAEKAPEPAREGAIRLQLAMARAGICSRRKAEELIAAGQVRVNGTIVTEQGTKVVPGTDEITVDGRATQQLSQTITVMLNKPAGVLSSATVGLREGTTVADLLAPHFPGRRLFPVGRLDKDTTGLLLCSDDGRLTYELTHPSQDKEKEYELTVSRELTNNDLQMLAAPIRIMGKTTLPAQVRQVAPRVVRITLGEGRNRQIRRLAERAGLQVVRLHRLRIGQLRLPAAMGPGHWRVLGTAELARARAIPGKEDKPKIA